MSSMMIEQAVKLKRTGRMEVCIGICALVWSLSLVKEAFKGKTNSLKFRHCSYTVAAPLTQDLILFAAKDSTIERQACP